MMIEALMYGFTPSATTDSFARPPPEKRSSRFSSWLELMTCCSCSWSTPGSGTCARKRNTTSMPRVKRILLRRSGVRNASRSAANMPTGLGAADDHDRSARGFDLLPRRRGDRVGMHLEAALDVAVREHLHARVGSHQALRRQRLGRDLAVDRVVAEATDVHADVRDAEARVLESTHLRDAHVDRRLAAFEPARKTRTASRELALRALARGLALAGGDPAANAASRLSRAIRRAQLVLSHFAFSAPTLCPTVPDSRAVGSPDFSEEAPCWLTTTRWATFRSIPRTGSESVCSTLWPVRRRPSASSVRRAAIFSPIELRCWRITRRVMTSPAPARARSGRDRSRRRACPGCAAKSEGPRAPSSRP